ncbi:MAG: ComF family protein [Bacteroidaceae bacterium]|nr:ComF family protein [Bacteroidaceae bacterium]
MKWISDLLDIIFPRHCCVCGELLSAQETDICLNCLYALPRIEAESRKDIEHIFWGKIDIERATSYIYYHKGSPYNNLIHTLKYHGRPIVGERLAYIAAKELQESGFFDGIDIIVPLPLSRKKKRKRGYNQCDYISDGISRATGIPVAKNTVKRTISNETQTHKNRDERWKNVEGIFSVAAPSCLEGRHILLVDDILTTGATLASCAKTIKESSNCTISIFTIGYTKTTI